MKKTMFWIFIAAGVMLFSCNNEKEYLPNEGVPVEKSTAITLNEAVVENATTEMQYEVGFYTNAQFVLNRWFQGGKCWGWSNKLRYRMNHCPCFQMGPMVNGFPKTITLDYGDSTLLRNGTVLSGKITIELSGQPGTGEFSRMITYENFGVDSVLMNGTGEMTYNRTDSLFRTFTSDLVITLPGGMTINRTSERQWEWIEGLDTELEQTDDMIQITGFTVAETSEGDVYRKEIVEPLMRSRDCRFIVQGVVEITLNGELISSLDYGDGECNDMAILTRDGETYEVELRARRCVRIN